MPEHGEERAELSARVIAHGAAASATSWTMLGRHTRLGDLLELGDLVAFDDEFAAYARAAQELRRPHDMWRTDVMRAMRALFEGRLDDGSDLARFAYRVGRQSQQPGALQAFIIQMYFVAWQRGGLEEILPGAASWAENNDSNPTWRAALALAYADVGRDLDARRELARVARDDAAGIGHDNLWLATLALSAQACWRTGDSEMASGLWPRLAPYEARNVTLGTALALGTVGRYLGLLHAICDDLDRAIGVLERAISANERMGSRLWTTQSREDLIQILRRRATPDDLVRVEVERNIAHSSADEKTGAMAPHTELL
jgi:hypothetical protein